MYPGSIFVSGFCFSEISSFIQHTENGKYAIHELQGTGSVMTRTEKGGKSCSMSLGTSTYITKPIFETQGCNLYRIDLILPQQIKEEKVCNNNVPCSRSYVYKQAIPSWEFTIFPY